jgi:hypothetical protein
MHSKTVIVTVIICLMGFIPFTSSNSFDTYFDIIFKGFYVITYKVNVSKCQTIQNCFIILTILAPLKKIVQFVFINVEENIRWKKNY